MRIDVLTIFPEIGDAPLRESIIGRARERGIADIEFHDLREFTRDRHRQVDDEPYGGGQGMVMKPEPFFAGVEHIRSSRGPGHVLLMTPQGRPLTQRRVVQLAEDFDHLIVLCGHYEGVDHRVVESLVDEEISIGDYVLTNGTIAAAVLIDSVVRLLPGALGDNRSAADESFACGLLEAPCYTRPAVFRGMVVPEVLLSGNHARIAGWKTDQARRRTAEIRPDLLRADDGS